MLKKLFAPRKKATEKETPKATHYDFVDWLQYANAGMMMEGNIYSFEYAINNLPSANPLIEIGSFCGLSTNLINFYLERKTAANLLFTSDKWEFENAGSGGSNIGGSHLSFDAYKEFVQSSFKRNLSFFSANRLEKTFPIELFSDEFFEEWNAASTLTDVFGKSAKLGGAISFAYIDGNHTYPFAKRDFENVDRWLEKGGFILFDDSGDDSTWEVRQVISEIKAGNRYEVIVNNPNYLLRKK